jgi:1,4-dihydroxy-2-naphthoyl-CoA hydrolase
MQLSFERHLTLKLHDVDAAGVMFFGHLFRHAHDIYEDFMAHIGFPLPRLLQTGEFHLPIVHAEADYRQAVRHGDVLGARLQLAKLGETSFVTLCAFQDGAGRPCAVTRCVHVCIDPENGGSVTLPTALREALTAYLDDSV